MRSLHSLSLDLVLVKHVVQRHLLAFLPLLHLLLFLLSEALPKLHARLQIDLRRRRLLFNNRSFLITQEELDLLLVVADQYHVVEAHRLPSLHRLSLGCGLAQQTLSICF